MTPIEIVLILIGIGFLVISMFLVDKSKNTKEEFNKDGNGPGKLTQEDIEAIKKKVDLILSDVSEEILQTTDDKLSHLSNEKIIAVTDYSNQILEKINQNHEEVIFLYNMLNEKESELKELVKQLQSTKKELKETALRTANDNRVKANAANGILAKTNVSSQTADKGNLKINNNSNPIAAENYSGSKTNKENQQAEKNQHIEKNPENNNARILELYKQGNSIVEISKFLGLGQGEVKLVIDLFNKKK
ncbi:MAG: DUF6115 domain-containing protein [Anaerocolumna aminovalerica]|uniref:DUF6115 domain-containing protein n=1 Tax=Anaerocolumna aminovalerica TaxID=1527 RepID=UPI002911BB8F|nr:DUF6115 domain-containing protein [Anaerocolumna aminovalerica]MDU6263847.1 DUF6115 domain-containing protein [Anaerocolumna aminovalerica]